MQMLLAMVLLTACNNDDDILVQGILGYGVFNYSSTADGKVHITLTHQWDQSYPQQWDVSMAIVSGRLQIREWTDRN